MTEHVLEYYKSVCEAYRLGNIETSYNAPIIVLLTHFGCSARDMSGERSGQVGENIDIKLWHSDTDVTETEPFAGIEIKKANGIDARARKQIKTEADRYGNAILTDNLIWQFWRSGEEKMYSGVELMVKNGDELELRNENIELFITLIEDFILRDPAQIKSSNKLAEYMAMHARTIRGVITGILKDDGNGNPLVDERQTSLPMFPELYGLYSRIRDDLRPAMTSRDFADMYAQTIVYGLFIARYNDKKPETFDRYEAIGYLQEESPLLKQFFMHIASSGKKHPTLEAVIDKLCDLYRICIISDLLEQDEHEDTIIHFYEEFLTYYDPALRKSLGVFYTPTPVVRYLVSTVDRILIEDFGIEGGLSNNEQLNITVPSEQYRIGNNRYADTKEVSVPRVAILDPACGTGSFGAEIIKYIKETYFSGSREAFYKSYIQSENGLLSRLIGFEIMMTSYVVAHLKIRRTIDETLGEASETQLPTNIFLTNTLAPPHSSLERNEQMTLFDFSAAISDEAYYADTWKTRRPIKVIIGNPPYLRDSKNPSDISIYKTETDGIASFGERKHGLNNDYVYFFRFAEQIVESNNDGIVAFVSDNSYLQSPTFRGMRASLLRTFNKIYIIDLHGNSNKKETSPDGSKDENIFDIMQGVSLFIGVKTTTSKEWAKVFHCDLWGTREHKFQQLKDTDLNFIELIPDSKMAYLIPTNNKDNEIYENGISMVDLFTTYVSGIQTNNDTAAVTGTKDELIKRIEIVKNATTDKPIDDLWKKYSTGQSAQSIQNDILSSGGQITQLLYRPFDKRWTYYSGISCGWVFRPREKKTIGHFIQTPTSPIGQNIGLVFARTSPIALDYAMIFITDAIIDQSALSTLSSTYSYVAPLYLHNETDDTWTANFDPNVLTQLTEYLNEKPKPNDVFDYIYGILYDPVYRKRFNEFLKRDFPRVPIINRQADKDNPDDFFVSEEMFHAYVAAGERLRKLHLMQIKIPSELTIEPNTPENMEIGVIKYKDGVLNINPKKKILGISEDVWNYRIGGYQVLDKWLKSHKGEELTIDSYQHISNIAGLLAETIIVQEQLRALHRQ
ncbi:MAG: hypothetical protein FWG88_06635 [Oscillospiraceae bacterium]|nr:hypothetical protein [Oscillospiraceae bacterium]